MSSYLFLHAREADIAENFADNLTKGFAIQNICISTPIRVVPGFKDCEKGSMDFTMSNETKTRNFGTATNLSNAAAVVREWMRRWDHNKGFIFIEIDLDIKTLNQNLKEKNYQAIVDKFQKVHVYDEAPITDNFDALKPSRVIPFSHAKKEAAQPVEQNNNNNNHNNVSVPVNRTSTIPTIFHSSSPKANRGYQQLEQQIELRENVADTDITKLKENLTHLFEKFLSKPKKSCFSCFSFFRQTSPDVKDAKRIIQEIKQANDFPALSQIISSARDKCSDTSNLKPTVLAAQGEIHLYGEMLQQQEHENKFGSRN